MQIRESAEDYLEAILILKGENGNVRAIDIAHHLGFSRPSVSIAMKNLRENGYITVSQDALISLTAKGQEIAERVYERPQVSAPGAVHQQDNLGLFRGELLLKSDVAHSVAQIQGQTGGRFPGQRIRQSIQAANPPCNQPIALDFRKHVSDLPHNLLPQTRRRSSNNRSFHPKIPPS